MGIISDDLRQEVADTVDQTNAERVARAQSEIEEFCAADNLEMIAGCITQAVEDSYRWNNGKPVDSVSLESAMRRAVIDHEGCRQALLTKLQETEPRTSEVRIVSSDPYKPDPYLIIRISYSPPLT